MCSYLIFARVVTQLAQQRVEGVAVCCVACTPRSCSWHPQIWPPRSVPFHRVFTQTSDSNHHACHTSGILCRLCRHDGHSGAGSITQFHWVWDNLQLPAPGTWTSTACTPPHGAQGVTPGVEQRSSFSLHNADLVCNGTTISVVGHPPLDPFADKFKGVRYRRLATTPKGGGALLQFVGPSSLLLRNSTATFLRLNQSIALIQACCVRASCASFVTHSAGLRRAAGNPAKLCHHPKPRRLPDPCPRRRQRHAAHRKQVETLSHACMRMLTPCTSVIVNNTVTGAGALLVLNNSAVSSSDRSVLSGNGNVTTGPLPEVLLQEAMRCKGLPFVDADTHHLEHRSGPCFCRARAAAT